MFKSKFSSSNTSMFSHEFYFNKKYPLKMFYHFFDREQKNLGLAALFFIVKHSPVWAMPVITANIISAISTAVAQQELNRMLIQKIILNLFVIGILILQNIPTHSF
ncbi:MAG: hypothetical protein N2509_09425, partial [Treponemataceae bacterium]|nr:hypothetical protein [Treponemataceae bacterium]